MPRRSALLRLCPWVLVALLLLKALMPGVAGAAAQAQGLRLVELCTVYGLRTVAVDIDGVPLPSGDLPRSGAEHAGVAEACALASLPVLDGPTADGPRALPRSSPGPALLPAALSAPVAGDASRAWWAGLKRAPPQR